MKLKQLLALLIFIISAKSYSQDTTYFHLSNPWNTVKDIHGKYLRKCVMEKDFCHVWDYNDKNILVTESFYTDTNFTTKLFCHKYYNETKGFLEQTRCYENGRLNGYIVDYNEKGDTIAYEILKDNTVINSWSDDKASKKPFIAVVVEAKFKGGKKAWQKYLQDNLYCPDSLKNIKGTVKVSYRINRSGKIDKVEILNSLNPTLDKIVTDVIMNSPAWYPAIQNGQKVIYIQKQNFNF